MKRDGLEKQSKIGLSCVVVLPLATTTFKRWFPLFATASSA